MLVSQDLDAKPRADPAKSTSEDDRSHREAVLSSHEEILLMEDRADSAKDAGEMSKMSLSPNATRNDAPPCEWWRSYTSRLDQGLVCMAYATAFMKPLLHSKVIARGITHGGSKKNCGWKSKMAMGRYVATAMTGYMIARIILRCSTLPGTELQEHHSSWQYDNIETTVHSAITLGVIKSLQAGRQRPDLKLRGQRKRSKRPKKSPTTHMNGIVRSMQCISVPHRFD